MKLQRLLLITTTLCLAVTGDALARDPHNAEVITHRISRIVIEKFNALYNVKGREVVNKASEHSTGMSNLNLGEDLCVDVKMIQYVSNPPTTVGILFYDWSDNLSQYQSHRYVVCKVNMDGMPESARIKQGMIAVFYANMKLLEPILNDKEVATLLVPINRKDETKSQK